MINLEISHQVHLTREQRYQLAIGQTVATVGIAVPVWLDNGIMQNIPEEVFCHYGLLNKDDGKAVEQKDDGFIFSLPREFAKELKMDTNLWDILSAEEQKEWFINNPKPKNASLLLDVEDGGIENLFYQIIEKRMVFNKRLVRVIHSIELIDIKDLTQSLLN